jgi:hypothetical protein
MSKFLKYPLAVIFFALAVTAYAATAFFTGERTTGTTKQCYYEYLGDTYTITIGGIKMCPMSIEVPSYPSLPAPPPEPPSFGGGLAFYTGEEETGMTKQCFYDYLGDTYTRTIDAVKLCPMSIKVGR